MRSSPEAVQAAIPMGLVTDGELGSPREGVVGEGRVHHQRREHGPRPRRVEVGGRRGWGREQAGGDRPPERVEGLVGVPAALRPLLPGQLGAAHPHEGDAFRQVQRRVIELIGVIGPEPLPFEDRGGGLARIGGRVRLVEGLAMPREEAEFGLTYYNSNSCWIALDQLLTAFALTRADLSDQTKVANAIRNLAGKMPTYITLKDVKKRWGHGQEDVFPVAQFEKLWVDMTALPELNCRFVAVPRLRGQQLKDQAQLDGWLRDGSATYVESLCQWE